VSAAKDRDKERNKKTTDGAERGAKKGAGGSHKDVEENSTQPRRAVQRVGGWGAPTGKKRTPPQQDKPAKKEKREKVR